MGFRWFTFGLSILILFEACTRNIPATPVTRPGTPPPPIRPGDSASNKNDSASLVYINGSWQCQVDGINYNGTIDSSFTRIDSSFYHDFPDTIIYCTGTSSDKRANIHFQLDFNRHTIRNLPYYSTTSGGVFNFDTCSDNILSASNNTSEIRFTLDSISTTALQAHFDGTASCLTPNANSCCHTITNGKFTAGFRGGNHDPNSFRYTTSPSNLNLTGFDPGLVLGYFNEARLISNSLVLDGTPTAWGHSSKFRLIIRTGGTVQPGVYHSEDGNVGLQLYIPSYYRNYVNDSLGSLTVTITQVNGDVVLGNFSGNSPGGTVASGSFAVRIKNYVPEVDSANKWAFGEDETLFSYRTFAGNILNAALTQISGRYYLTVNGESDRRASVFKLMLSSVVPIKKGTYASRNQWGVPSDRIDSLYFISPEKIWNGNNTFLFSDSYSPSIVQIDSIDANHVEGVLMGVLNIYLSSSGVTTAYIREGKFIASF
jgi:hypothetical protein